MITTKKLTTTETTFGIIFWMAVIQLPLSLIGSDPAVFLHLEARHILPAIGVGIAGLTSHYCLSNAFRAGDATLVVPLDFMRIPLIAVVGWAFYGERLDIFVLLGALIIVAGVLVESALGSGTAALARGSHCHDFSVRVPAMTGCVAQICSGGGGDVSRPARPRSRNRPIRPASGWKPNSPRSTAAIAIRRAPTRSRRAEDAVNRQQFEVDRLVAQSRRMGCESSGFFSIFNNPPPQCGALNRQIDQQRNALERMQNELEQLNGGTTERAAQRQSLLIALGNNGCGPQYRSAALHGQQGGFFDRLFGNNGGVFSAPGANGRHVPHHLRAHLRRLLFSDFVSRPRRIASATTSRPASACARRRKFRSTPITIPARK